MGKAYRHRSGSDCIYTPRSMVVQFLEESQFIKRNGWCIPTVLEPACGAGHIVDVLKYYAIEQYITCYDVKKHYDGKDVQIKNFLDEDEAYDYVITNPPYTLLDDFILQAKRVSSYGFAFLCNLNHLHGLNRWKEQIYTDEFFPLTDVYIFTRQANLKFTEKYKEIRKDGKYPAGACVYAWFVWNRPRNFPMYYSGYPCIHWINNQEYVGGLND